MPLELICQGCSQKLRVSRDDAGKQARCPKCGTVFTVPLADEHGADGNGAPQDDSPPPERSEWYLRTEDGLSYGPVTKPDLDRWVAEGRVTAQSDLRREDEPQWQAAQQHYPHLRVAASLPAKNPFADDPSGGNPYSSPGAWEPQYSSVALDTRRYVQPHRGGLVLALSIVGLIFCTPLCIAAWVMGAADLREMGQGRMDRRGYGLTLAGVIVGIIGTAILTLLVAGAMLN